MQFRVYICTLKGRGLESHFCGQYHLVYARFQNKTSYPDSVLHSPNKPIYCFNNIFFCVFFSIVWSVVVPIVLSSLEHIKFKMTDCDEYWQKKHYFKCVKNLNHNSTWRVALVCVILFIRFIFTSQKPPPLHSPSPLNG